MDSWFCPLSNQDQSIDIMVECHKQNSYRSKNTNLYLNNNKL